MRIPPHAKYEIIYEMTKQNGNRLSVSTLCEIAGVSRSGYYNYLSTEDVRLKREEQDRKDFQKILEAYNFRGYNKGGTQHIYAAAAYGSADTYERQEDTSADEKIWTVLSYPEGKSV